MINIKGRLDTQVTHVFVLFVPVVELVLEDALGLGLLFLSTGLHYLDTAYNSE